MKLEDMTGVRQENKAFELCVCNLERLRDKSQVQRVVDMLARHVESMEMKHDVDENQSELPLTGSDNSLIE